MLQNVSAETIYCQERARQAREKADTATAAKAKSDYLAAEERWLALGRSHELQRRLSATLGDKGSIAQMARASDPEVVAIINSAHGTERAWGARGGDGVAPVAGVTKSGRSRAVLGIDAAWTASQPSGVALVTETSAGWRLIAAEPSYERFCARADGLPLGKPIGSLPRPSALLSSAMKLCGQRVDLVAVDMPLARVPIKGRRYSDNAVSRAYGALGCGTHSPSEIRPGRIGREIAQGFMTAGYPLLTRLEDSPPGLIEVYPHPALVELTSAKRRLPYKVSRARAYWKEADRAQRRDLLFQTWKGIVAGLQHRIDGADAALRLPDLQARTVHLKAYEDTLDAVVCAWVGVCTLEGRAVPFGDAISAIWIPVQRAAVV